MKLTIELVPSTSWYSNVRSNVTKAEWDIIRKKSYKNAKYKCEICGGKGNKHPVECHETWDYNESTNVQTLTDLISLCPKCHKTKHVGLSQIRGEEGIVIKQLMKVNEITYEYAINYIQESFVIWSERSQKEWKVDISYLDEYLDK